MSASTPSFITHYTKGEPFISLTSFSMKEQSKIISSFTDNNTWGLNRFLDPEYLRRRSVVEEKLFLEFKNIGGKPQLKHPIYFTLGRNVKFEEREGKLLRGYVIDINEIPVDCISFTYGDSLLAYDPEYREQVQGYLHSLCARLFRAENLKELISHKDLPENPLRIEAQLWIDPKSLPIKSI